MIKTYIKNLESQMITYQNLVKIETQENNDSFAIIDSNLIPVIFLAGMDDMQNYFQGNIVVRKMVQEKIYTIQSKLKNIHPNLSLCIMYGYRSIDVQIRKFKEQLTRVSKKKYFNNPMNLYEEVHRYIAVPSVSGHPTGGAIDVVIKDMLSGEIIDFGSKIYDFSTKKSYVFSSISKGAFYNRMLLRKLMLDEGFAPYDGEWWHFSYGDKEWAYYYKRPFAIYDQIKLSDIKII